MPTTDKLDQIIAGLKPMLTTHGKDINVLEATDERIKLALTGFCGDCGCSSDYTDGLKEMLTEHFPGTDIQFEVA